MEQGKVLYADYIGILNSLSKFRVPVLGLYICKPATDFFGQTPKHVLSHPDGVI